MANARLIVSVGVEMGMNSRDITTALVAAMQESSLRNITGGDRDSAGLFQQRPSMGWGSYSQVTNPLYASRKFYSTLKGVKGRSGLSIAGAAQAVQRSGNPGAYANWIGDATRLAGSAGLKTPLPFPLQTPGMDLEDFGYLAKTPGVEAATEGQTDTGALGAQASTEPFEQPAQQATQPDVGDLTKQVDKALQGVQAHASGIRGKLIDHAMQSLGTPYVWGGSAPGGFDCSGLIFYWYNRLGVKVPRVAYQQATVGKRASIGSLEPGDFVLFNPNDHHIAIYLGGGRILEAPHTGAQVRTRALGKGESAYGVHLSLPSSGPSGIGDSALDLSGIDAAQSQPLLNFPGLESDGQEI